MTKDKTSPTTYRVGTEIWWFKINQPTNGLNYGYHFDLKPGDLELVHDQVKEIKEGMLICWHCTKRVEDVWGTTRQEAWNKLKTEIEKWGSLD